MNAEQIKNKLKSDEYDILKNDPNFNSGIILLTTGGSHSYGTSIDTIEHTSDIDIRGIKKNSAHEILTMEYRDKPFENRLTDTVIYPFKQVINLLLNVNPNIIEILGTKEEQDRKSTRLNSSHL